MEYAWILVVLVLSCTQLFVGGDKQQQTKPTNFFTTQGNQNPVHQLTVKPPKLNVGPLFGKNDLDKQETLQEFLAQISEALSQKNPLESKSKN